MLISIDFDNTYTSAPMLWNDMIWQFQRAGHSVILTTCRSAQHSNSDLYRAIKFSGITDVYFTDGQPKKPYLAALGIHPGIWIDDDPASIDPLGRLQPCDTQAL